MPAIKTTEADLIADIKTHKDRPLIMIAPLITSKYGVEYNPCVIKSVLTNRTSTCKQCGCEYHPNQTRGQQYCERACYLIARRPSERSKRSGTNWHFDIVPPTFESAPLSMPWLRESQK